MIIKAYVDQFHQKNEQSRRDVGIDFYDELSDLVKNNQKKDLNDSKLTNIDSITVNRNPGSEDEVTIKKYVDDSIGEGTIVGFNQTLENYLKKSVGKDVCNLTIYDEIQITDTTIIKNPNTGGYLLQNWIAKYIDRNKNGKIQNFIKSTKTKSPTSLSCATSLFLIGDSFINVETGSNNHGNNVFVSFERTDIIQISNITFHYNRFSILTNFSLKSMVRFRIQLLLEDNNWSTRYNIPQNDRSSDTSTDWTKLSLNFTEEKYSTKLVYD